ncbi:MAG: microcin C ABC transporter permease YejB [Acidobacteriota bacterium]|jgi:microcin C transport system permease protein|nr:microcin C ABC transporter permease YejB [Acidobacteriota bacterium]
MKTYPEYFIRRLLLIVPTIFGIMLTNFIIIQLAPGGPIERIAAKYTFGPGAGALNNKAVTGADSGQEGAYRETDSLNPAFVRELEIRFGFDKPLLHRFAGMVWDYLRFDFGKSYHRNEKVLNIILEKLPVSLSLALWSTAVTYLIAIPLGIRKATRDGSPFDVWSSVLMNALCAIPGFILAVLLIVLFAGGAFLNVFPIRGLVSPNWHELGIFAKVMDYLWHIALPVICMAMSGLAVLTMLTKNSFVDELNKLYVTAARSKGLTERAILFRHVFRNAMLIVISGFPTAFLATLFTGSMLIEMIFSLDGIGLLGINAVLDRDYPVVFAALYIYALLGLVFKLIGDIVLTMVDPRITFDAVNV